MKKVGLIAVITCALSSCGSGNYLPCPSYGSVEQNNKHLSAHGQENDYYTELANDMMLAQETTNCENCDEID
tara:strand:+ start:54 stop:269 length:216 start_codon:yes stop_codon:yes gene_type:complete